MSKESEKFELINNTRMPSLECPGGVTGCLASPCDMMSLVSANCTIICSVTGCWLDGNSRCVWPSTAPSQSIT